MPLIIPPYIPEGYAEDVVDLDGGDIRGLVIGKSVRLWWEHGVPCPCRTYRTINGRTNATGEPQQTCTRCGGAGIMYVDRQQIIGAKASTQDSLKLDAELGPHAKGTMLVTLLPEHVADHLDRYTLLDGCRTHSELRKRKGTVDRLRYPVLTREFTSGSEDDASVAVQRSIGVQFCMASDAEGTVTDVELVEGVDFEVNADGRIDWTLGDGLGTAPAVGEHYSIRYYARPRFVLEDHIFLTRDLYVRDNGVLCLTAMPVKALLVLDFLGGEPPVADDNPQPTSAME